MHAARGDGLGAMGDDILDLAVDDAPDDVPVKFRAREAREIAAYFLITLAPDFEGIELARVDQAGIEAVVEVMGVVGDLVRQIGDLRFERRLKEGARGCRVLEARLRGGRRRGRDDACGGPRGPRRRD